MRSESMDGMVVDASRSCVRRADFLHLALDLLGKGLELVHFQFLLGPADA